MAATHAFGVAALHAAARLVKSGAAVSLIGDFIAHGHPSEQFDRLEILGTRGAITLDHDRLRLRGLRRPRQEP